MKHRRQKRSLGRERSHRRQLLQSLTSSLLKHGYVVTTEAKAKELRTFFEPLVTKARGEMDLPTRRRLLASLMHKQDLEALAEVAKQNEKRPGGYLRLTHLPPTREDGAAMMRVEVLTETSTQEK